MTTTARETTDGAFDLSATSIRCGDRVRHEPTGETWVVAFADLSTGELSACGWPEGIARISDCTLVRAATDEEHRELVAKVIASGGMRGSRAARLYVAPTPARDPATHDAPAGADGPGDGGAGEGDAAFVDRMTADACVPGDRNWWRLLVLARRALTPPSTSTAAGGTDNGWRTIESAPPNTWLLTYRTGESRATTSSYDDWNGDWEWMAEDGRTTVTHTTYAAPTHWRPLPPPPGTPAPSATPGLAEVSEAEVEAAYKRVCDWRDNCCTRSDIYAILQAAARVRAPEPARVNGLPGVGGCTTEMAHAMSKLDGYDHDRDMPGLQRWADYWDAAVLAAPVAPEPARPDAARGEAAAWQWQDKDGLWRHAVVAKGLAKDFANIHGKGGVRPLYAAPPIAPTLAAFIMNERLRMVQGKREETEGEERAQLRLLDRLAAAAPTLASAPAPDAGGMARAVEIVEFQLGCYLKGHNPSYNEVARDVLSVTLDRLRAALRQADARHDVGGAK